VTIKPLIGKQEAQGAIRVPKRWSVELDKQWTALPLHEGGLTVQERLAGPPRHWPDPSVLQKGIL